MGIYMGIECRLLIVIRGKALKSVSFVLNEFSQIANTEPKLTTCWHKRGDTTKK